MCGIAGIVAKGASQALVPAAELMAAALDHRGPDSNGTASLGDCLLVNARLAILDLSDRGRQPMSNADGTVWITYNGEVYNAAELRQQLQLRGYHFRSTTDTEVVLHLYEEMGERFVEKLRGMFALAIWDTRSQRLVLARDRFGIKPLYVCKSRDRLIFGSELKTLLASNLIDRRLDPAGLRIYLQLGHVPPPWTIIQGVAPLEPGHIATWQDGELNSRPYWTPDRHSPEVSSSGSDLSHRLGEILLEAMQKHLISDVPMVLFLSGGTDSACLAALARSAGARNVAAMTVGFPEAEYDETELTHRTAKALDLPLEVFTLQPRRVSAEIDRAIWAMDEPTVDGINSYWISKLAADAGYKVALSGQGGDELFGGYTSLAWFERLDRMGQWTSALPAAPFSWLLNREPLPFRWRKLSYLFGGSDAFLRSQMAVKVLFLESDLRHLLVEPLGKNGRLSEAERHLSGWAQQVADCELQEKLAFMDIHTHLQPRLLRDLDAMSMAHSLEVRPVFLDNEILEFLLPIPARLRLQQKRLLLDAVSRFLPAGLLEDLKSRRKRTFTFPLARWMGRDIQPLLDETFSPEHLKAGAILQNDAVQALWKRYQASPASVGWSRVWSLFVLARWCETMNVTP